MSIEAPVRGGGVGRVGLDEIQRAWRAATRDGVYDEQKASTESSNAKAR